jgi:hypothetical protein
MELEEIDRSHNFSPCKKERDLLFEGLVLSKHCTGIVSSYRATTLCALCLVVQMVQHPPLYALTRPTNIDYPNRTVS